MAATGPMARKPRWARGLAGFGVAAAWIGASVMAAAVAIVFTAVLVVIALLASALIVLATVVLRASRPARHVAPDLAHHAGGHSWVAYGPS
ncbi:MAG TPA: hypothetical protein VG166_01955 [Caulobacteraceae bacterium]|nr:hypothetical protein [Caulobacteraceae bacterium]